MKRRRPLARGAPLKRGRPARRRRPVRRARAASAAALPKDVRVVDEPYLAWLRRQHCGFCGAPPPSEAHHVLPRRMGGANQRDDLAMPVCARCHLRCDGQKVEGQAPWSKNAQREQVAAVRARYLRELEVEKEPFPW